MRTRKPVTIPAVVAVALLLVAGPAMAGGWATVELSSTPDGMRAGQPWVVDLKILQHGRTPLPGLSPTIRIVHRASKRSERFAARPRAEGGVYRAQVEFPTPGRWQYFVDDGFTQVHSYPVVEIGEQVAAPVDASQVAADGSGGGSSRTTAIAGALIAGLAAAGLTFALVGRRRTSRDNSAARPVRSA